MIIRLCHRPELTKSKINFRIRFPQKSETPNGEEPHRTFTLLFVWTLHDIIHPSSLPFFQSIFPPYYKMWTRISWNDNKGTFNFVSIVKKNAAPRSLCIVLPVLQGRNYKRAGQHAMSPPLFVSASNEIFVVSFHEAHIPSKFLVIPLFTLTPSSIHAHTHTRTHYMPKKFALIVNVSFMTESMLASFSRKEEQSQMRRRKKGRKK